MTDERESPEEPRVEPDHSRTHQVERQRRNLAEGAADGKAARRVRAVLIVGAVAFGSSVALATSLSDRPALPTTLAALLLILLPALSLAQTTPNVEVASHRKELYTSTAILLFALGALGLLGSWFLEVVPRQLLHPPPSLLLTLSAAALVCAACLGITYLFHILRHRAGWMERPIVHDMMPDTREEKRLFAVLSLAAGTGEEIAFRGFLPAYLSPWFGSYLAAALIPALAFGLMHAYQGAHGIARTTLMGVVMAVGVWWTGSLWPVIVAHTVLDLVLGLVLKDYFLAEATSER
ncbi:MAG: CPBP family intramembrane glutamic endopeptidase [Longimicrobiales bacterium]